MRSNLSELWGAVGSDDGIKVVPFESHSTALNMQMRNGIVWRTFDCSFALALALSIFADIIEMPINGKSCLQLSKAILARPQSQGI